MLIGAGPAFAQQDACGVLEEGHVECPTDGGPLNRGIRYDMFGDITVRLGDGLSLAPEPGLAGVIAISGVGAGGSVTIDGAGASIQTVDAIGAVVEAEGDIVIDLASVSSRSATPGEISAGIYAFSTFGSTTVNVGSVETVGDYSNGILVQNAGSGAIKINAGSISTNGFASDGLALVGGGPTEIRVGTIEGTGDYIWGVNAANGIETDDGYVFGDTYVGVDRIRLSGSYNAGVVIAGAGNVAVSIGELDIEGFGSRGADIRADGSVRIDVGEAVFRGEQTGVIGAFANMGDAVIHVGSLRSEYGGGISAGSYAGNAVVDAELVQVSGDLSRGISTGSNYGNAAVKVDEISTNGFSAYAITAEAMRGDVNIFAREITTAGNDSYGIYAMGARNLVVIEESLLTSGDNSIGILSSTTRGDNLTIVGGEIETRGQRAEAIRVTGRYGSAVVRAGGSIRTSGDLSAGIWATGEDGQVVIEAQDVATSGAGANGIHARTRYLEFYWGYFPGEPVDFTGDINIRAANVTVSGEGATGISARGLGNATILAGNVSSVSGYAIETDMIGKSSLDLRGEIRSENASAVWAKGADVAVEIAANASVFGAHDGLVVDAIGARCVMREPTDGSPNPCPNPGRDEFEGGIGAGIETLAAAPSPFPGFAGKAQIVNRGAIEAGDGFAVRAQSGGIALENHGRITGAIRFAGGNDLFDNAGLFVVTRDSDFGAGVDVLRNSGTLRLAGGDLRLDGLDRFENSGAIDLRNAVAGDTLTLAGDYIGREGAILYLDIDGAARASDRLVVEGAALGSTRIALMANPAEARLTKEQGVVLIQVGDGSSDDAFEISEAGRDIGLVRYALAYDATNGTYSIVGRAGAGAYRQLGTLQASEHMWDASADAWRLHGLSRRDALFAGRGDAETGRLWGTLQGGRVSRGWSAHDGAEAVDLAYRQTRYGGQIGYDLVGGDQDAGSLRAGLTGGYSTAKLGYKQGGERIDLSTANIGLYAAYVGEKWFANLLLKYDRHDVRLAAPAFVAVEGLDGSTWGVDGEIGLRLGSPGMFVEPTIGVAWTSTSIDALANPAQRLDFEDARQVEARIGARFGGTSNFSSGAALTLYASGNAVRSFGDDYGLTVTAGERQFIEGGRLGTFAEGRLGLSYRTSGGFELFADGQAEFGRGYDGLTGRAGFRIGF